jgi:hypothetical protein
MTSMLGVFGRNLAHGAAHFSSRRSDVCGLTAIIADIEHKYFEPSSKSTMPQFHYPSIALLPHELKALSWRPHIASVPVFLRHRYVLEFLTQCWR